MTIHEKLDTLSNVARWTLWNIRQLSNTTFCCWVAGDLSRYAEFPLTTQGILDAIKHTGLKHPAFNSTEFFQI